MSVDSGKVAEKAVEIAVGATTIGGGISEYVNENAAGLGLLTSFCGMLIMATYYYLRNRREKRADVRAEISAEITDELNRAQIDALKQGGRRSDD